MGRGPPTRAARLLPSAMPAAIASGPLSTAWTTDRRRRRSPRRLWRAWTNCWSGSRRTGLSSRRTGRRSGRSWTAALRPASSWSGTARSHRACAGPAGPRAAARGASPRSPAADLPSPPRRLAARPRVGLDAAALPRMPGETAAEAPDAATRRHGRQGMAGNRSRSRAVGYPPGGRTLSPAPLVSPSNASRTFPASSFMEKGFRRKFTFSSSTPGARSRLRCGPT